MSEPHEKSLYEELMDEIETGPLSILSGKAKARIANMIRLAMKDGYERGESAGKKKGKQTA